MISFKISIFALSNTTQAEQNIDYKQYTLYLRKRKMQERLKFHFQKWNFNLFRKALAVLPEHWAYVVFYHKRA